MSQPELRPDPLRIDSEGYLIAVGQDGAVLRISPFGLTTAFPGSPAEASTERPGHKPGAGASPKSRIYMAIDASGYRYQTDAKQLAIQKVSPAGTRVAAAIGRGSLDAPADLVVDRDGNIYVIDNHMLKRIPVITPPTTRSGASSTAPAATD